MTDVMRDAWEAAQSRFANAGMAVRAASSTLEVAICDGTVENMSALLEVTSRALMSIGDDLESGEKAALAAKRIAE